MKTINLKEHILIVAGELSREYGIAHINVRMVAEKSGIALGTIYNYYPAKGDIIAGVIEEFWREAFACINLKKLHELTLLNALEYTYYNLLSYLNSFKDNWLEELSLLSPKDKSIGRLKEKEYMEKIHSAIMSFLRNNEGVSRNYNEAEMIKLSNFIFENIMLMLKNGEEDFSFFKKILQKICHT